MKYAVTEISRTGHRQLYIGLLKHVATARYEAAVARYEPGAVVTLSRLDFPPVVLRKSDEITVETCCHCFKPIDGDLVPAKDLKTGQSVCSTCVNSQRHARASA